MIRVLVSVVAVGLILAVACSEEPTTAPEPSATSTLIATPTMTSASTPTATALPNNTPTPTPIPEPTYRGLTIADEDRCSPYDPDDYRYPPSVEASIVENMGGITYGPYTGRHFADTGETDIEHIVARSEAHDSGLCAADKATRRQFASDLLNLTLAHPDVNRQQKSDKDAAEWLPSQNRCWFADRIVQVRLKYSLTINRAEADTLDSVLSGCASVEMEITSSPPSPTPTVVATATQQPETTPTADIDALELWDDNGNGQITCAEAKNHGIAPVRRDHPAYQYMQDRDGDGIVCEN